MSSLRKGEPCTHISKTARCEAPASRQTEKGRSRIALDRPLFDGLSSGLLLLSCGLCLLFWCGMRMIRNCLHYGLIHGLRAFFCEGSTSGNDPVFGTHGSSAASAALDPARIDTQLGFAAGEIGLRIDGAFSRQIRALLGGFGIADDDQFVVCILLQVLGHVVQFAFALVVHAPWLLDLRHVLEAAISQLGGLWWWRWRIFNVDLSGGLRIQATRIGTSCAHRDRTGRCTCGIQGCGIAAA